MTANDMAMSTVEYNISSLAWGIGIFALGAVLVITALAASISPFGMTKMGAFGTLMVVYGIVMLFILCYKYRILQSLPKI